MSTLIRQIGKRS